MLGVPVLAGSCAYAIAEAFAVSRVPVGNIAKCVKARTA
jgi:hypothetical protein